MSDVLIQQINLYRPTKIHEEFGLTFRKILLLWLVVGIGLSTYTGFLFWKRHQAITQYETLASEKAKIKAELDQQIGQFNHLASEEDLRKEINQLIEKRNEKMMLISILLEQGLERTGGFSAFLKALSETHVDGTWYTNIQFKQNGQSMALRGNALYPSLIPKLFESLDSSTTLDGKAFDSVTIQSDTKNAYVAFDIKGQSIK